MTLSIILFVCGFVLLVKGGDVFVNSAVFFSRKLHIPELVIGATIVSIGTTLPEATVSITAAFHGSTEVAYGNAIGSIICNTALIAGISQFLSPTKVDLKQFRKLTIFFFAAYGFYMLLAIQFHVISRLSGFILLLSMLLYVFLNNKKLEEPPVEPQDGSVVSNLITLVVGIVCVFFGAQLVVENVTHIALCLGVTSEIIALTVVALGTSLPELVTTITSLVKGHTEMSVGNIIGANIFNIILVSGGAAVAQPIPIPVVDIDILMGLCVMCVLCIPTFFRGKVSRIQGFLLLCCYAGYLFYLLH